MWREPQQNRISTLITENILSFTYRQSGSENMKKKMNAICPKSRYIFITYSYHRSASLPEKTPSLALLCWEMIPANSLIEQQTNSKGWVFWDQQDYSMSCADLTIVVLSHQIYQKCQKPAPADLELCTRRTDQDQKERSYYTCLKVTTLVTCQVLYWL